MDLIVSVPEFTYLFYKTCNLQCRTEQDKTFLYFITGMSDVMND